MAIILMSLAVPLDRKSLAVSAILNEKRTMNAKQARLLANAAMRYVSLGESVSSDLIFGM